MVSKRSHHSTVKAFNSYPHGETRRSHKASAWCAGLKEKPASLEAGSDFTNPFLSQSLVRTRSKPLETVSFTELMASEAQWGDTCTVCFIVYLFFVSYTDIAKFIQNIIVLYSISIIQYCVDSTRISSSYPGIFPRWKRTHTLDVFIFALVHLYFLIMVKLTTCPAAKRWDQSRCVVGRQ